MRKLGVGVLGCGEAAQIIHVPTLLQLPDLFTIAALHDASPSVTAALAGTLPGARPCADVAALVACPDVDAVLVATPSALHAAHAIAAMRAGKDVLIEKPMCVTRAEAAALAAAEAETGRIVQVGYMRRFAPAFLDAAAILDTCRGDINHAHVRDVVGRNPAFMAEIASVVRGDDVPAAARSALAAAQSAALTEAVGTDAGPRAQGYTLLLELASHDLSAMRGLLGTPGDVLCATMRRDGRFLSAVFDYGDFVCAFETGRDAIPRFDTSIEVLTERGVVRVDYDTPYIRHQPARLTVTEACTATGVTVRESYPTRQDAFVPEWRAFHRSVIARTPPKASLADAAADLELIARMMAILR